MKDAIRNYEDVDSWKTVIFLYNAALKEVGTKLEILNDEFQHVHKYNPIEHIKTRIKSPESIVKKLKRYGYETSIENMVKYDQRPLYNIRHLKHGGTDSLCNQPAKPILPKTSHCKPDHVTTASDGCRSGRKPG